MRCGLLVDFVSLLFIYTETMATLFLHYLYNSILHNCIVVTVMVKLTQLRLQDLRWIHICLSEGTLRRREGCFFGYFGFRAALLKASKHRLKRKEEIPRLQPRRVRQMHREDLLPETASSQGRRKKKQENTDVERYKKKDNGGGGVRRGKRGRHGTR